MESRLITELLLRAIAMFNVLQLACGRIVCLLFVLAWAANPLCGQSAPTGTQSKTLRLALAGLDSSSLEEWSKAEVVLKGLMGDAANRQPAALGLALFHIKRGHTTEIQNFVTKAERIFPQRDAERDLQLLRIKLWSNLTSDESTPPTTHFAELLETVRNGKHSKSNLQASVVMLGTMIGMLDASEAHSPIQMETLTRADQSLRASLPQDSVRLYVARLAVAKERAQSTALLIKRLREQPRDESQPTIRRDIETTKEALAQLDKEGETNVQQMQLLDDELSQIKNAKRGAERDLATLLVQWRTHPELHNPIEPNRTAIENSGLVKTTVRVKTGTKRVKKYKTERDKDGRTRKVEDGETDVDVYETRRRRQEDIDRDVNQIYIPLLRQYQNLMTLRKTALERESDLKKQIQNGQDDMRVAEAKLKALREKQRSNRLEVDETKAKLSVLESVDLAIKNGQPAIAFRPPAFPVIDVSLERRVLMQ